MVDRTDRQSTAPFKILVIEDEDDIARLILCNLELEGFEVTRLHTGENAVDRVREIKPQLILLDLMLPVADGMTICKELKKLTETKTIPVIMLTAKSSEHDVVKGLSAGADDYITKPFSPRILSARVQALLRRTYEQETQLDSTLTVGPLTIDTARYEISVDGQPMDFTLSEYLILKLLSSKPGWVFSRSQIIDSIRGDNYAVTDRSIDFQVVGIRKKLGQHSDLIATVRGVGYRFKEV
jgi:two-component system, OmpR family, alkaline phosphatase synthesis response regulator PhoP